MSKARPVLPPGTYVRMKVRTIGGYKGILRLVWCRESGSIEGVKPGYGEDDRHGRVTACRHEVARCRDQAKASQEWAREAHLARLRFLVEETEVS